MEPILCGLALALIAREADGFPIYSAPQGSGDRFGIYNRTGDSYYPDYDNYDLPKETRDFFNNTGVGDYDPDQDYPGPDDYNLSYDYYDSLGICTSEVLIASEKVKTLSSISTEKQNEWNHWTIVPFHAGGSVTVAKRDNVVSQDIFNGGCSDLQIFQTQRGRNTSRMEWCHEKRLLQCESDLQMAYHIFGYSPTSEPRKGIDVVYVPKDVTYDYSTGDKAFSMYYYECGGKRFIGDISSPIFPEEVYEGSVSCKWELEVKKSADYGIIRFPVFDLPFCDHHHLVIEEDTIIKEEDVTESLINMLRQREHHENVTEPNPATERSFYNIEKSVNGSQVRKLANASIAVTDDENKDAYFYRDGKISKEEVRRNPKTGIHVVVITKYCGKHKPKRTFSWRRGSKNVTLTFVSEHLTMHKYGFKATFSVFSWRDTMKKHRGFSMGKYHPPRTVVSHVIFNYIILIIFVPIGLTIGLSIIVFHIKQRGPTLREFYLKEKRELKLRRANTERMRSVSPAGHRLARRAQSLDIPNSSSSNSEMAERGIIVHSSPKRRGSLLNVRFLITKKKSSYRLNTKIQEESSSLTKTNKTRKSIVTKKSGSPGIS